jgi:hypothetical protein
VEENLPDERASLVCPADGCGSRVTFSGVMAILKREGFWGGAGAAVPTVRECLDMNRGIVGPLESLRECDSRRGAGCKGSTSGTLSLMTFKELEMDIISFRVAEEVEGGSNVSTLISPGAAALGFVCSSGASGTGCLLAST